MEQPFKLQGDASHTGAGAVLLQTDDHSLDRTDCYTSRKFNNYQLSYSVIEKETLVLVWFLGLFHVYLGSG